MDDRIFPGVLSIEEKVKQECFKWYNLTEQEFKRSTSNSAITKALLITLLQEYKPKWIQEDIAKFLGGMNRTIVPHVNKVYKPIFEKDYTFYNFMYLNTKAAIEGREFFTFIDLYDRFVDRMLIIPTDRKMEKKLIRKPKFNKKSSRTCVKIMITYLKKNSVSRIEISTLIQAYVSSSLLIYNDEEAKIKEGVQIIKEEITTMINYLKVNEKYSKLKQLPSIPTHINQ